MTAQPPPDRVIVVRGPWQRMALGWEIRNEHGDRLAFVWDDLVESVEEAS